jgi:hypothetical protein
MTYDALVSRLGVDDDPELEIDRTPDGVTLQRRGIRLELVGDQQAFDRHIHTLAREAKVALGRADGLGLFLEHLHESMGSTSAVSAVWRFSTDRSGRASVIKTAVSEGSDEPRP